MEHWEFLLQKEGDRSWLPLDSPDVEILEGRYRIVARSSNSNTAIETRITHVATAEVPPKRRVQKRSCHTNQDGLMVVIPFTRLEPGLWELQCSPNDLLTDLMAGAQPHAVTLQVVARESEEDWDTDWTVPADDRMAAVHHASHGASESIADSVEAKNSLTEAALTGQTSIAATDPLQSSAPEILPSSATDRQIPLPPEVAEILGASMGRLFQIAEQMSEQLVDEVLQDFDLDAIADEPFAVGTIESAHTANVPDTDIDLPTTDESNAVLVPSGYTLAINETFALTLDQTALVAARGEVLTLSGRVMIVAPTSMPPPNAPAPIAVALPQEATSDPWDNAALTLAGATAQELQLCLRDPQSLQILVSDRQSLTSNSLTAFTFSFSLPDAFATHLVLGEVLLCGTLAGQPETLIALTTQAFSITVDPNALVGELAKLNEALTTEIDDEERIDLPLELSSRLKEQASPALDLSFLDLAVVAPADERSPRFPSLAGQPLPPQLYRPDPEQAHSKPLDLPAFKLTSLPEPAALQLETVTPETSDAIAPTTAEASSSAVNPAEAALAVPKLADATPPEASKTEADVSIPSEVVASEAIAAVALDRTTADSSDKTLDLPSSTQMAFQSLKLQDRFLTRLTSLAADTELSALLKANVAPGRMPSSTTTASSAADARSLIEEVVVDDDPQPNQQRRTPPDLLEPSPEPPTLLVLPADEPVPTPTLEVTTGELIAGKPIHLRVKLPNLLPRIYVKLWVTDRQTRSVLDGPRWLVDFLPNGLGDLEAIAPMTVPFGSVEIRLEAIAVEMHTQRESHKVTVDRTVVPPDLPIVSLDDFND